MMFVKKSTYDVAQRQIRELNVTVIYAKKIIDSYTKELENRANIIKSLKVKAEQGNFTQDEIKTLIRLCHPDKHQGDERAAKITRKLLTMRNK